MSRSALILAVLACLACAWPASAERRDGRGARAAAHERASERRGELREELGEDWDEVLVRARGDASELAARHRGTARGQGAWKALRPPEQGDKYNWYRKLQRDPDVLEILPNYRAWHPGCRQMSIDIFETGEILDLIGQVPIRQINGERSLAAPGVTVAVLDSGVALVEELEGRLLPPIDLLAPGQSGRRHGRGHAHGRHLAADDPAAWDGNGHGTAMASLIAVLAGESSLLPIRVVGEDCLGTVYDLAEGIRAAADAGAEVISISLGTPRYSRVLEQAVEHASSRGALIVAAAGNSGELEYPALFPQVFAVTAVDETDWPASFAALGLEVDLAAPGVGVTARVPETGGAGHDYARFTGTSPATALTAAAAAAVVARTPGERPAVRAEVLRRSVRPVREVHPQLEGSIGEGVLDLRPLR